MISYLFRHEYTKLIEGTAVFVSDPGRTDHGTLGDLVALDEYGCDDCRVSVPQPDGTTKDVRYRAYELTPLLRAVWCWGCDRPHAVEDTFSTCCGSLRICVNCARVIRESCNREPIRRVAGVDKRGYWRYSRRTLSSFASH